MTEIPGIIVPAEADTDLEAMLEEVGTHEPLMTLPQVPDEGEGEGWSGAMDAMIAAGLFRV